MPVPTARTPCPRTRAPRPPRHGLWSAGESPNDYAIYYNDREIALAGTRDQAANMAEKLNLAESEQNTVWLRQAAALDAFADLVAARLAFVTLGRAVAVEAINAYHDAWAHALAVYIEAKRAALGNLHADTLAGAIDPADLNPIEAA